MLDRPDSRRDRVVEPFAAVGVRRDGLALPGRLGDRCLDLLEREVGDEWVVVVGDEAAGRRELDPVRPDADHLAHGLPHLVDPVDDEPRLARVVRHRGRRARARARHPRGSRRRARRSARSGRSRSASSARGRSRAQSSRAFPRPRPAMSRTKVTPASSVTRAFCAVSSAQRLSGVASDSASASVDIERWSWQSKIPGSSQRPEASTETASPARRFGPTAGDDAVRDVDVERCSEAARSSRTQALAQDERPAQRRCSSADLVRVLSSTAAITHGSRGAVRPAVRASPAARACPLRGASPPRPAGRASARPTRRRCSRASRSRGGRPRRLAA